MLGPDGVRINFFRFGPAFFEIPLFLPFFSDYYYTDARGRTFFQDSL